MTFLVAFTSPDVTVSQDLSKVRIISVGKTEKFSIKMVKAPLQNNKNWASSKCLVRKREKMYLPQILGM